MNTTNTLVEGVSCKTSPTRKFSSLIYISIQPTGNE